MKILYTILMNKKNKTVSSADFNLSSNFKYAGKISDDIAKFFISWAENKEFMNENSELDRKFMSDYHRCLSNYVNFSSFLIATRSSNELIESSLIRRRKTFVTDFYYRMKEVTTKYGNINDVIIRSDKKFMNRNYGRELFQWIFCEHLYKRYEEIAKKEYFKYNEKIPDFPEWVLKGLSCKGSVRPKKGMPEPNDVWDLLHLSSLRDVDVITVDKKFFNMLQNTNIDTSILETKWIKSTELGELLDYIRGIIESK